MARSKPRLKRIQEGLRVRKILNCSCTRRFKTLQRKEGMDMRLNSEKDKGFLGKGIIWSSLHATGKILVNMEQFKMWVMIGLTTTSRIGCTIFD